MSYQTWLQEMIIVTLVMVFLAGCVAPIITPVSKAPVATDTPEPVTPTSTLSISTPVLAQSTPMPTTVASQMNQPVRGDEWEITVLDAEDKGKEFTMRVTNESFKVTKPNSHFLLVTVKLKNLTGQAIKDTHAQLDIELRDSAGKKYPWLAVGTEIGIFTERITLTTKRIEGYPTSETLLPPAYLFVVPDDATDLYFVLPELTPVLLNITIKVEIVIKPDPGLAHMTAETGGEIPIAILSTQKFNAPGEVDTSSLTFSREGHPLATPASVFCDSAPEDVNSDGLLDLVCHFDFRKTGLSQGWEVLLGVLRGKTVTGISFYGIHLKLHDRTYRGGPQS